MWNRSFLKKNILYLSVLLIIFVMAARCYYEITDDFQVRHITYHLPFHSEWDVPSLRLDNEIFNEVFHQKLSYIGKGAQCYVFGTEDGRFVVKFIKFKHHKVEKYQKWRWVPFYQNVIDSKIAKHERKLQAVFDGYVTGFERLRDKTGLVALHLNKTSHLNTEIFVKDKVGWNHKIDLDAVPFIIQKKALVTKDLVKRAILRHDWAEVEKILIQLIDFLRLEYQIGLLDRDRSILTNTGFVDGNPVHIDVGKLTENRAVMDPISQYEEFDKIFTRLKKWIRYKHVGDRDRFIQFIDDRIYPYFTSITLHRLSATE